MTVQSCDCVTPVETVGQIRESKLWQIEEALALRTVRGIGESSIRFIQLALARPVNPEVASPSPSPIG